MKRILFGFLMILISLSAEAQPPNILWTQTFGYAGNEECFAVQQTSDQGYILAGQTTSFSHRGWDIYLVKTDSLGNLEWDIHHGDPDDYRDDKSFCVSELEDGYLVGGLTEQYDDDGDMYLLKVDLQGNLLWDRYYDHGPGPTEDCCYDFTISENGYVLGGYWVYYAVGLHIWCIRTDNWGNMAWDYSDYPGSGYLWNECRSILPGGRESVVLAGHRDGSTGSDIDMFLMKLDSQGGLVWENLLGTDENDYCYDHIRTDDQGFLLAGNTYSAANSTEDCMIIKTDSTGNYQWHRIYDGDGDEYAYSIEKSVNSGYIIAGEIGPTGANQTDIYVFETDTAGNMIWEMDIGGPESESCNSLIKNQEDNYILAGYSSSYGAGVKDMYLVCLTHDFVGIPSEPAKPETPLRFGFESFPNPFNAQTTIGFELPEAGEVSLTVYDVTGREVRSLVTGHLSLGKHEVVWDAEGVSSGVYLVRLELQSAGTLQHNTRKVVLVK